MRRKLLVGVLYVAALVLAPAFGGTALTPSAAGATTEPAAAVLHFDNPYATWACGSTRPGEEYTLQHAHVAAMGVYSNGVAYVRGSCQAQAEDIICFWVGESRSTGVNRVYSGPSCVIVG